jgi:hypothetical protein
MSTGIGDHRWRALAQVGLPPDFVRPRGNSSLVTLGVALFGGGIFVADAAGRVEVVVPPAPTWPAPAAIAGVGALVCVIVALVMSASTWLYVGLLGFLVLLFAGVALTAYLVIRRARSRSLVIDGARAVLQPRVGRRALQAISAEWIEGVRVQVFEDSESSTRFDVLATLPIAELWLHQSSSEAEARRLAETTARLLRVAFDPHLQRKG